MSFYEHKTEEQDLKGILCNYNILAAKYEAQISNVFGCTNLFENM